MMRGGQTREARHTQILTLVRRYPLASQPEIQEALEHEAGIKVHLNTLREDLRELPVIFNKVKGHYEIHEYEASREEIYDELINLTKTVVHDVTLMPTAGIVLIDTDFDLAKRVARIIWSIKCEEQKNMRRIDRIAGVNHYDDQVQVFFLKMEWASNFAEKVKSFWGRPASFDLEKELEDEEEMAYVDKVREREEREEELRLERNRKALW